MLLRDTRKVTRPETPRKTTEANTGWVLWVSRLRKGSSEFERSCSSTIKSIVQFHERFHGDSQTRTRGYGETRGAGTHLRDVPDPSHNRFVVLRKGQKVSPRGLPGVRQQILLCRIVRTGNKQDQRRPTVHVRGGIFLASDLPEGYRGTGWL